MTEETEDVKIERMSIQEFRDMGLLFLVNQILHAFKVVLVFDKEKGILYPAHSNYEGFSEKSTINGYRKLHKLLKEKPNEAQSQLL